MLQIDHLYEFLFENMFYDFGFCYPTGGVLRDGNITNSDIVVFTRHNLPKYKIFFYDQEPVLDNLAQRYLEKFDEAPCIPVMATSERSAEVDNLITQRGYHNLYYFFHGLAALDWYRGHYALNFNKKVVKEYYKDFITYNRIIVTDRSYRIYFISNLIEKNLLPNGLVSFSVADDDNRNYLDEINHPKTKLSKPAIEHIKKHIPQIDRKLIIDHEFIPGFSSASIPITIDRIDFLNNRLNVDSFWHVVTETVFYYDKLHLTEKTFKPIVSKQPFMTLAAPGNLEYLRSYGFKTFDSVIDESYDKETNPDLRIQKVVEQLKWYCDLSPKEKTQVQRDLEPIIEYNFNHFYGDFKHVITTELLQNCQRLFKEIGYDDSAIAYKDLYRVLTS